MNYLFFDTETTGLPGKEYAPEYGRCLSDNGYPRLVQLAFIFDMEDTDNNPSLSLYPQRGCVYVKPSDFSMPADTTAFSGITDAMLSNGMDIKKLLLFFAPLIANASCLIGHNLEYDINVLKGEYAALELNGMVRELDSKPVMDTMEASIDFCAIPFPEGPRKYDNGHSYKNPKLGELYRKLFEEDLMGAHDAMADVEATKRCFYELRTEKNNLRNKYYEEKYFYRCTISVFFCTRIFYICTGNHFDIRRNRNH